MNNIYDLKPKNIGIDIIFIILFSFCLIDNLDGVYNDNFKLSFDMMFAGLDLFLIIYYVTDLIRNIKHNRNLKSMH